MKRTIFALAAAALAGRGVAVSAPGHCRGCGVAAGVSAGSPPAPSSARPIAGRSRPGLCRAAPVYERGPAAGRGRRRRRRSAFPDAIDGAACHIEPQQSVDGTLALRASRSANNRRQRRMCSSTAAVGQQSTFRPFAFW